MIIWTERILEISLESLIFGFFGDFRKFLKINNLRTAEDMKKIMVPTVISRTRRFRKNGSFSNLSKIWWFMGGKSRDSLTPVLGTWSWTDFILTLHETFHIMWLSIYIIKSLATKFITRPWSFPCLLTPHTLSLIYYPTHTRLPIHTLSVFYKKPVFRKLELRRSRN